MEAAGVIEAVGDGVTHLAEGDRAAYAVNPPGAYGEARVMPAAHVVKLPDEVPFYMAAAMMLKRLATDYFTAPRFWWLGIRSRFKPQSVVSA